MTTYLIGDLLYQARIEKGYSQEELSFGICSLSSLSRIENNLQVPSKRIFDALVEKLGIQKIAYNMYISKGEMELNAFANKILRKLAVLDFERLEELVIQFEEKISEKDDLNYQFLIYTKAVMALHHGEKKENVLKLLFESLDLTIPDFSIERLKENRLITFMEISILNSIGILLYDVGQKEAGLQLLNWLLDYMDQRLIDEDEKAKKYPMVLYSLTKRILKSGEVRKAYELCEKGIAMCIEYGSLYSLPYLLMNKALAAAELNNKEEAQCISAQVSALLKLLGKQGSLEKYQEKMKSRYGITFF